MISGLKVTVKGDELRTLCIQRAAYHQERAAVYAKQIASLKENRIEGVPHTSGDPVGSLTTKLNQHNADADELVFIGNHLKLSEEYQLDSSDMHKLGICRSRY